MVIFGMSVSWNTILKVWGKVSATESAVQRGVLGRGTGGRKVVMVEQVWFLHVVFGETSVDSLL